MASRLAMLVPTTVLAQQHYETFRQRLAAFPVEVEMLSRFRSHKQQERIVKRLHAEGASISSSARTA
jgi:transcription-repair coupling factor (superfamily II helicase)